MSFVTVEIREVYDKKDSLLRSERHKKTRDFNTPGLFFIWYADYLNLFFLRNVGISSSSSEISPAE